MRVQRTSCEPTTEYTDLLIFDDILPSGFSPFRTVEYGHYLSFFDAKLVSAEGWHLWISNEAFPEALAQLNISPEQKRGILPFGKAANLKGRLAYVTFLGNASALISYFEAQDLPFIFQLYPGGGFQIDQPDSDQKLRRVVLSNHCRKVIVTQQISRDYLIERIGCDPTRIELIFGGVFESCGDFDFHRDKKIFGDQKNTLDICFVAHKYSDDLVSKGYQPFVAIALELARADSRLRFHVVGDYNADDVPVGEAAERFTFYGRRENEFFKNFYAGMDLILSINKPFVLTPGAFDGFPTGACIEAGFHGVLNCINDPLELNPTLIPGQDFIQLNFDHAQSVDRLRELLANPDELYRLAYNNWRKFHSVFGTNQQLWARTRLIASQLALSDKPVMLPSPAMSGLDAKGPGGRLADMEAEITRLLKVYHNLETHYLSVEAERKRLEQYIRARERKRLLRFWPLKRRFRPFDRAVHGEMR